MGGGVGHSLQPRHIPLAQTSGLRYSGLNRNEGRGLATPPQGAPQINVQVGTPSKSWPAGLKTSKHTDEMSSCRRRGGDCYEELPKHDSWKLHSSSYCGLRYRLLISGLSQNVVTRAGVRTQSGLLARDSSYKPWEPREGEPRQPNKDH